MTLTVVIGGGAAGIVAARTLHDAGCEALLIEASDRLGGRAHSLSFPVLGATVDLGCGWLYSAGRNPWTRIAEKSGFTVDRSPANWDQQWRNLGFSPEEREAHDRAWECWKSAAMAARGGPDRPLSDFIANDDPWRPLIDAISGYVNGAPLAQVSLHDWAAYEDVATEDDWSVREGYGTLIASYAADLPTRLNTPATRIDRRGRKLKVETSAGAIEADRVIVAVPTPV